MAAACSGPPLAIAPNSCSLLAHNFNLLWAAALNARRDDVGYFCMIHADIAPQGRDWLNILLQEIQTHEADVLSVVIPIKDRRGLTSTALDLSSLAEPWHKRRLTMHEVFKLPETFGAGEVAALFTRQHADCEFMCFETEDDAQPNALLVNTGLFIADIRKPWAEQVRFTIEDAILKKNGQFYADCDPEDWNFSRQVAGHGGRVLATRKVQVRHAGGWDYSNAEPWGDFEHDQDCIPELAPEPEEAYA